MTEPKFLSLKCVPSECLEHIEFCALFVFLPQKHTSKALTDCRPVRIGSGQVLSATKYAQCCEEIEKAIVLYPQALFFSFCSHLFMAQLVYFTCLAFFTLLNCSLSMIRAKDFDFDNRQVY